MPRCVVLTITTKVSVSVSSLQFRFVNCCVCCSTLLYEENAAKIDRLLTRLCDGR